MEKRKKKGRWVPWLVLLLVAGALAALPMLRSGAPSDRLRAVVKSAPAARREIDTVLIGGGQLESSGTFTVEIPEKILLTELLVSNGDTVCKGDPIARVDPVSVMAAIADVQDTLTELSETINSADSSKATQTIPVVPGGKLKILYAQKGDSVQDVMLEHGALAVISLDNTMAVRLPANEAIAPADRVNVAMEGKALTGRVRTSTREELIVVITDENYAVGTPVTVTDSQGAPLGSGELYICSPWTVMGDSGTITYVSGREGQTFSKKQTLFTVTVDGKTSDFQAALDKRHLYEDLLTELFQIYNDGVITAPCDGIVSGIVKNAPYMLCSSVEGDSGPRLVFLADTTYPARIVTTALQSGTVGRDYEMRLLAYAGSEPASGTWTVSILPAGLSCSSDGIISGKPTAAGAYTIDITFTDGTDTDSTRLPLTIAAPSEKVYYCYPALVTNAGGEAIWTSQSAEPYEVTSLNTMPAVTKDSVTLGGSGAYTGQVVVNAGLQVNDFIWVVLENPLNPDDGVVQPYAIIRISSGTPPRSFGRGGSLPGGTTPAEDDGLYSLGRIVIASVTSQEQMTVSVTIDEQDITRLYEGQHATITMNAFSMEAVDAVITHISNSGTNAGGSTKFTVTLELAKSREMLPGMSVTAVITLERNEQTLCVPAAAVVRTGGKTVVYTARNEKTGSPENPVEVTIGAADPDYVQILSGLNEGDIVYYEIYESGDAGIAAVQTL